MKESQPSEGPGAHSPAQAPQAPIVPKVTFKLVASAETSQILGFGDEQPCEIPLSEAEVWIGRKQALAPPHFRLPAELKSFSKKHSCLKYDTAKSSWFLCDKSKLGTFLKAPEDAEWKRVPHNRGLKLGAGAEVRLGEAIPNRPNCPVLVFTMVSQPEDVDMDKQTAPQTAVDAAARQRKRPLSAAPQEASEPDPEPESEPEQAPKRQKAATVAAEGDIETNQAARQVAPPPHASPVANPYLDDMMEMVHEIQRLRARNAEQNAYVQGLEKALKMAAGELRRLFGAEGQAAAAQAAAAPGPPDERRNGRSTRALAAGSAPKPLKVNRSSQTGGDGEIPQQQEEHDGTERRRVFKFTPPASTPPAPAVSGGTSTGGVEVVPSPTAVNEAHTQQQQRHGINIAMQREQAEQVGTLTFSAAGAPGGPAQAHGAMEASPAAGPAAATMAYGAPLFGVSSYFLPSAHGALPMTGAAMVTHTSAERQVQQQQHVSMALLQQQYRVNQRQW